jgi:predicted DNA-binding protein
MSQMDKTPATSFRIGDEHRNKLMKLSRRTDISRANLLRRWIDDEYNKYFDGDKPRDFVTKEEAMSE